MKAYGETLTALADPTRRAILELLRPRPMTVSELADKMPVSRPAVSQHLAVLREAHLVNETRDGTRRFYRADPKGLAALRSYLEDFWGDVLADFANAAEAEKKRKRRKR
ncbi:MAG: winged helix-turn-helix transcriptional regulator [Thermoanaerobaculia bacterium]|nr:winged helix-turn-helix transcriptional regulator [Thermoanaerobaculia bacterium]